MSQTVRELTLSATLQEADSREFVCVTDGQAAQMCDFHSALMFDFYKRNGFENQDCLLLIVQELHQENFFN